MKDEKKGTRRAKRAGFLKATFSDSAKAIKKAAAQRRARIAQKAKRKRATPQAMCRRQPGGVPPKPSTLHASPSTT